jgi:hypothetical protein
VPTCPQGHESEWSDFCSVCGTPLAGGDGADRGAGVAGAGGGGDPGNGPAAAGPGAPSSGRPPQAAAHAATAGAACPHCGYPRDAADTFCESCGYDFSTGQLPAGPTVSPAGRVPADGPAPVASPVERGASSTPDGAPGPEGQPPASAPGPAASGPASPGGAAAQLDQGHPVVPGASAAGAGASAATSEPDASGGTGTWWAIVDVDRNYYDRFSAGGPVAFPADPPASQSIPLLADRVSIGRRSRTRGSSPQIDLSGPPEDPAVSHTHATLLRQADGSYALVDGGSTNGTRLNDDEDAIPVNTVRPLADGDRILLGALSRIRHERR